MAGGAEACFTSRLISTLRVNGIMFAAERRSLISIDISRVCEFVCVEAHACKLEAATGRILPACHINL